MPSSASLDSLRLAARLLILQELALRSYVGVVSLLQGSNESAKRVIEEVLEASAKQAEKHFLSDPTYASATSEERALYADEIREMIDEMKASVSSYFPKPGT